MKNIIFVSHYFGLCSEGRNSRFATISGMLHDCNVEIITSKFDHSTKSYRQQDVAKENNYTVKFLHSEPYRRNISLKRFVSDFTFSRSVKKYLAQVKVIPDVIYLAVPSLAVGNTVAKYCKRNRVRMIIDVQDLWPEAFKMVFDPPVISNLIYYPFKKLADAIYRSADDIVAVSNTYLERAKSVNKKVQNGLSVYLGTNLQRFDNVAKSVEKVSADVLTLAYIGTLGASYRVDVVIRAMHQLKDSGNAVRMVVMGDGHKKNEWKALANELSVDVEFIGNLDYETMVRRLVQCDVCVNCIEDNSAGSIINKVGDYACSGLPVINTQICKEYVDLIEDYHAGISCRNQDIDGIARAIDKLRTDISLRLELGKNNRKLAEDLFDRDKTYQKIVELIMEK